MADDPHNENPVDKTESLFLTEEERATIMDKARIEARKRIRDQILKDERALALEAAMRDEKVRLGLIPEDLPEDMVTVTVDVAPYAAILQNQTGVRIDNKLFLHGSTYTVKRSQAISIADMCWQTWRHQREIEGRDSVNPIYRERGATIGTVTGDGRGAIVMKGVQGLRM